MIKAVIFDIDGVLIDSFEANFKFFQDLFPKAGYKAPTREEYKPLFHLSMLDVIKLFIKSDDEVKRIFQMGVNREVPYPSHLFKCPEGMKETVESLSKNYILGIVTSRIKHHPVLAKVSVFDSPIMKEIEEYIKDTVCFEDTENHKPHPEPLLLIAQKLGVNPEEAVYIGDAKTDLECARSAGMKFILFPKNDISGADASTDKFSELPDLIKKL